MVGRQRRRCIRAGLLTIQFDKVSLDEAVVVSKLDTLKTIYETYVDSEAGAVL